ncbi:MAG: nucleotidyltransferase family protein [Promethearchaeota archaeon]
MSDLEIEAMRSAWRERFEEKARRLALLKRDLREAAKRCAQLLREEYGVSKVVLFGSLARPRPIHERSDIDLAVEGLPDAIYFKVLVKLYDVIPRGANLDLVTLESISASFRERIDLEGEVLA